MISGFALSQSQPPPTLKRHFLHYDLLQTLRNTPIGDNSGKFFFREDLSAAVCTSLINIFAYRKIKSLPLANF
jgi:hypothetical protein